MKNKVYVFSILLLCCITTFGQAPDYEWALTAGTPYMGDGANLIRVDANGNSYVTGKFFGSDLVLGNDTFHNSTPSGNIFIVKYDVSGNLIWARSQTDAPVCGIYDIALDANANLYIAGAFQTDSITFGNITLTNTAPGSLDIFIVKYDSSGNVLWLKGEGGNYHEYPNAIALDANANLFLAGNFDSDSITFGTTTIVRAIDGSAYIVKYDSSGNVIWAKGAGATGIYVKAVTADNNGNAYITGYFALPVTFDTITLVSNGYSDIFIAKYDSSGDVLWARNDGGGFVDIGTDIDADIGGNIYLTGYFESSTIAFGTTILSNVGNSDVFVVKYDPSGNALWAQKAAGSGPDEGESIVADENGNSYISGHFSGDSITIGSITYANHTE